MKSGEHTGESLSEALGKLLSQSGEQAVNLGRVLQQVGDKGFGLVLILLSLPSALPVPAAGYSTPFGILMAIFAVQMIMGRSEPIIPERAKQIQLPQSMTRGMLRLSGGFFRLVEKVVRPRGSWMSQGIALRALGVVVVIMSALMMLPIPLTNTFPAMVICLIGIGLCEDDSLFAGLAFLLGLFAVVLYAGVIYVVITQGPEAIEGLKEMIKGFMKP